MDDRIEEIAPCPICGSEPTLSVRGKAAGYQCRGKTHLLWAYGTTAYEAAANWNTRAAYEVMTRSDGEAGELRKIIAELGYCTPDASLEFMRLIPAEVRAALTQSSVQPE